MNKFVFPKDFIFGVATSATQIEGAAREDGRGDSIWDVMAEISGKICDGSTLSIACDQYHHYKEE